MTAELTFAPEVEEDIAEAYAWYEAQRLGLGEEFLSAVSTCIDTLRCSPTIAQRMIRDYRRAVLRRFPCAVFYRYRDGVVTVCGVFHTSRDPNTWRWRLS